MITPAETCAARLRERPDATPGDLVAADRIEAGEWCWAVRHEELRRVVVEKRHAD